MELTLLFLLQKSHLWRPSIPLEFQFKEPPSPSKILKAVHGIGIDIFWNHPITARSGKRRMNTDEAIAEIFAHQDSDVHDNFTPL